MPKLLTNVNRYLIFVSSFTTKAEKMTHATEFFEVQKALGIAVNGMSDSAFRAADEANASRIEMFEKDGCLAVLVDANLVVLNIEGEEADITDEQVNQEWIEFFKS